MLEQTTKALVAFHLTTTIGLLTSIDQHIADDLVRTLGVVVLDVLVDRAPQRRLTEEVHLFGALRLDREHEKYGARQQFVVYLQSPAAPVVTAAHPEEAEPWGAGIEGLVFPNST